ncbi:MAG: hypothetical protein H6Q89_241 [Myxococcaceae bacterium]|nr:hypothetical protein [Myxococcaceae bacterium]
MPEDDELEFGVDLAPRLLGQACALLGPHHDLGQFEELLEQRALTGAWDALAQAVALHPAPPGFWELLAGAAAELGLADQVRRAHASQRGEPRGMRGAK